LEGRLSDVTPAQVEAAYFGLGPEAPEQDEEGSEP